MKVINLGESNSILNLYMSQLRDKDIQKDSMRFRRNLERLGEIFAYEISKTLNYQEREVVTPLGIANVAVPVDQIVLSTILRAGLPLQNGIHNFFDNAQCNFIAEHRKYDKGNGFHVSVDYISAAPVEGKVLILADTLLATGTSLAVAYERLCEDGEPLYTHFVCPISSKYAVENLSKDLHGKNITLWTAAIDEELTNRLYIVPGLGDAGDLAYGTKK